MIPSWICRRMCTVSKFRFAHLLCVPFFFFLLPSITLQHFFKNTSFFSQIKKMALPSNVFIGGWRWHGQPYIQIWWQAADFSSNTRTNRAFGWRSPDTCHYEKIPGRLLRRRLQLERWLNACHNSYDDYRIQSSANVASTQLTESRTIQDGGLPWASRYHHLFESTRTDAFGLLTINIVLFIFVLAAHQIDNYN